jgi:hypothetical protein
MVPRTTREMRARETACRKTSRALRACGDRHRHRCHRRCSLAVGTLPSKNRFPVGHKGARATRRAAVGERICTETKLGKIRKVRQSKRSMSSEGGREGGREREGGRGREREREREHQRRVVGRSARREYVREEYVCAGKKETKTEKLVSSLFSRYGRVWVSG